MGKLQHVLHNALHSWIGPVGGYNRDMENISPGKRNIKEFKHLWELIGQFSREVGVTPKTGSVLTVEECVCKGKQHFKGYEHYIKVIFEEGAVFGVVGVFRRPGERVTRVVVL